MIANSPTIIVLHGGPGAPGSAHMLATGIEQQLPQANVLEPYQRGSADAGRKPLSVARHVADLHVLIAQQCGDAQPLIVGHSWGAMLALAYAAAHPHVPRSLTLIGCGTFDIPSRQRFVELRDQQDYHVDVMDSTDEVRFDEAAHQQTWLDMLQCQARGLYPKSFSKYHGPVMMLHGRQDPHPGEMIRDCLLPLLTRLRYQEFDQCGHEPWRERKARDAFYAALRDWLMR